MPDDNQPIQPEQALEVPPDAPPSVPQEITDPVAFVDALQKPAANQFGDIQPLALMEIGGKMMANNLAMLNGVRGSYCTKKLMWLIERQERAIRKLDDKYEGGNLSENDQERERNLTGTFLKGNELLLKAVTDANKDSLTNVTAQAKKDGVKNGGVRRRPGFTPLTAAVNAQPGSTVNITTNSDEQSR